MSPTIRPAAPPDATPLSALAIETQPPRLRPLLSPEGLRSHLDQNLSPHAFTRLLARHVVLVADLSARLVG